MSYRDTFKAPLLALSCLLSSCNFNLYQSFVKPDDDSARLEEARIKIDDEDYPSALQSLQDVEVDSNDLRLLRSSARLGAAGLSLWSILLGIIDSDSFSSSSSSSGIDKFFDQISGTVVGENEVKTLRLKALTESIQDLLDAPEPSASRVKNLACFLAGILALPTMTDATTAITSTSKSLEQLAASVDLQNPNASCPDLSGLNSSLIDIASVQGRFSLILSATDDCKLIDNNATGSGLNAIETQLTKFNQHADAGCSATPSCGSSTVCKALGLGCVYTALTSGEASTANDGKVSQCELVQNCLTAGTCF
ncbi:MAG: hypothetical protein NTX25_06145 [Proteobacteria bacterium]|nr:hypothetical protein [Pseudomonadota bacterium]